MVTVGFVTALGGSSHILQCRDRMSEVGDAVFSCVSTPPLVKGEGSIEISDCFPEFSATESVP